MRRISLTATLIGIAAATPLAAQVGLPSVGLPRVGDVIRPVSDATRGVLAETTREIARLADDRLRRIDRLVRANRTMIERDAAGEPARRGEVLAMDASAEGLKRAEGAGFAVRGSEEIDELGLAVTRLAVPQGMTLAAAQTKLALLLPEASIAADNLHFQSGAGTTPALGVMAAGASTTSARGVAVGMIDGAPGKSAAVAATRGFAAGAPLASNHGSAVASLLLGAGAGPVRVADVYGSDKAGGNALAIARGLGWLVGEGSKVVTISLVGPRNPVLERAIAAARAKGVVIVAAVGNDGPAAPPVYPASYPGVVAVTAVDGKNRRLIEAGQALNLDYAAPGADIYGIDAKGKRMKLRGTSFATPLVAARLARGMQTGNWRSALDREAIDLGAKGEDAVFGRGLLCPGCGRK